MLQRALSGSGGGRNIDKVFFGSFGGTNSGTISFPDSVDAVYFCVNESLNNIYTAIQDIGYVEKGGSITLSPYETCTVSLAADGNTLNFTKNTTYNYWACIGIKYA